MKGHDAIPQAKRPENVRRSSRSAGRAARSRDAAASWAPGRAHHGRSLARSGSTPSASDRGLARGGHHPTQCLWRRRLGLAPLPESGRPRSTARMRCAPSLHTSAPSRRSIPLSTTSSPGTRTPLTMPPSTAGSCSTRKPAATSAMPSPTHRGMSPTSRIMTITTSASASSGTKLSRWPAKPNATLLRPPRGR